MLVATSIGEESLDVEQVDCVSASRMTQRMGRTGRRRSGKVNILPFVFKDFWRKTCVRGYRADYIPPPPLILASEGGEVAKYKKDKAAGNSLRRKLRLPPSALQSLTFHDSCRMVPHPNPPSRPRPNLGFLPQHHHTADRVCGLRADQYYFILFLGPLCV